MTAPEMLTALYVITHSNRQSRSVDRKHELP